MMVLNGTGVVALEKLNKSEILSVKLREKAINGRALVEPVQGSCLREGS